MKAKLVPLGLALVVACAGNPAPGEPGYSYNLDGEYAAELVGDDGTVYTGTLQFDTMVGGEVTGSMDLTSPMGIGGEVTGMIMGSEVQLSVTFDIPDAGCGGIVAGTAIIHEGGDVVEGTFDDVTDDCGGAPTSITFTATRSG